MRVCVRRAQKRIGWRKKWKCISHLTPRRQQRSFVSFRESVFRPSSRSGRGQLPRGYVVTFLISDRPRVGTWHSSRYIMGARTHAHTHTRAHDIFTFSICHRRRVQLGRSWSGHFRRYGFAYEWRRFSRNSPITFASGKHVDGTRAEWGAGEIRERRILRVRNEIYDIFRSPRRGIDV